ncbi:glycosyltransferase [Nocardioides sp. CER19]|uniref:glycosyltransferase n=1 Tax=Nocardioides sp. CER19 TaxID=3038538 RepID=UPI00244D10C0|nr:glycosyltransferase [Nocardioides sp. CER19]MDH2416503.1 glycosyltransferase [Nocardioides sp. CER19]
MRRSHAWARLRFVASWLVALALVGVGLPRAVDLSWHGVMPVLRGIHWPAALALTALWLVGLFVHSFVLTAAAPSLTHRRALTLNVTGSAISNVVPLGGAAGVELNRRMMRAWGIDARAFTGYTFLTNLWDVGAKLLLPVVGVIALERAGEAVTPQLRTASLLAGVTFAGLVAVAATLLASLRGAVALGRAGEWVARPALRLLGKHPELDLSAALLDIRNECVGLVGRGWLRMSAGIIGYVALQGLLLGFCLHLTGAGTTWAEVLAGFAVERMLTVVPITPGGVGIADLGLVAVLLALGGDPAGVTAAAVLYRAFVFAVEIPVGGGALGLWLLGQRLTAHRPAAYARDPGGRRRVVHVTDVFLPRLGGIETHVDDLARHQRAQGLEVDVLTPTAAGEADPPWVRRLSVAAARRAVTDYDVVHVHVSMFSPYAVGVARAAMSAGIPTLLTVHSMWLGAGGILRLAALAGVRRWPVAWSAVSDAAAESFRRSLGTVDVAVLPNAIDVAAWGARPPDREPSDGPVTVVSVMRLMRRKRPLQLLALFRRVRRLAPDDDVRLVIVGDGPLRPRMERYVRRHDLGRQVRITGRIPRAEVLDQLRAASLYVAPAPKESFGIAALEARCAGLPVVANRRSGVGEFVRDRVDGVLVADDAEMAVALADLVRDADLRARMTAHNRRVAPRFDWSDVLERTEALYQEAAERAARAPEPTVVPGRLAARA